jgi:hypothetical protein
LMEDAAVLWGVEDRLETRLQLLPGELKHFNPALR